MKDIYFSDVLNRNKPQNLYMQVSFKITDIDFLEVIY